MPRKSTNEEMGENLSPDDVQVLFPKGWKVFWNDKGRSPYWGAKHKRTGKIVTSRYFQNVLTRVILLEEGLRDEH